MSHKLSYVIAVTLVVLIALPAAAANVTFEQVSWLDSTGAGYVSRYSDWGQAVLSLSSADHSLFSSMTVGGRGAGYGGYINIVTDASGSADWNVQNLPIFYVDSTELDGRLPQDVWFDLGVTPGTAVTSLNSYFTIDSSPQLAMPSGTLATNTVTEFDQLTAGTRLWLGPNLLSSGGLAAPPPAANFPGAAAGETVGWVGSINGAEGNVPTVSEDDNGCAPGAAARSIKYLSDQHPEVNVTDSAQQVYTGLYGAMSTTTAGTMVDDFLDGKIAYCQANNLPIMSTQTSSFAAAMDTLNRNGDVELGVYWGEDAQGRSMGGHATMVTEIQELHDAGGNVTGYVVRAVDDPVQGDGNSANTAHTYKFDANGKLVQFDGAAPLGKGGSLVTFQIEDVRKMVDPLEFRWGGIGIYPMPPGNGLPNPVGVGQPAGPKTAGVRVHYYGAQDASNPGNLVSSQLIANPTDDAGPCATLELDLANVTFTPVDPLASTTLAVGLNLGHVLSDDVTGAQFMPILSEDCEIMLENFILTSSFFDITYQIHLTGEDPHVYRLHGEVPEELLGKAWIISEDVLDPDAWIESFFDVYFEMELTPDAYALLGADSTLLNMQLYGDVVPEPASMGLLLLGGLLLVRRRKR